MYDGGDQDDLFTGRDYPREPGYKQDGVSKENAEELHVSGRAGTLRRRVASLYRAGFRGTADEAAAAIDEHWIAIRPRCSELKAAGLLEITGERRRGAGGRPADVLKLKGDM